MWAIMYMTLKSFRYISGQESLYIEDGRDRLHFSGVDPICGGAAVRWLNNRQGKPIMVNFICYGPECVLVLEDDQQDRLTILGL